MNDRLPCFLCSCLSGITTHVPVLVMVATLNGVNMSSRDCANQCQTREEFIFTRAGMVHIHESIAFGK